MLSHFLSAVCRALELSVLVLPILVLGSCGESPPEPAPVPDRPPNIILILADDLGYGDLGSYGQAEIQTPELDRMAAEGVRFTDFYAGSTVCAPSRSVLMTGLHMGHTPVRGNADREIQTLAPDDLTVAEVLQSHGYATGLYGKWGLGDEGNTGRPNDQGFDEFFGYLNQVHAHNYYPEFLWRNEGRVELANEVELAPEAYMDFHGGVARKREQYSHDLILDEALGFIERKRAQPFFLFLALTIPHANNEADRVDWAHGQEVPDYGRYADKDWPEEQKGTAAMISRMDEGIGRLRDRLEELGIDRETVVLFSSDNGPHAEGGNDPAFFDSNGPLRGIKRDLYEGGIRVPLIAWGPGFVPSGITSDHIGYFGDFIATAAELAGTEVPEGLDSVSLAPVLSGRSEDQEQHEFLYWEFYEHGSAQAVRADHWKAVRRPAFTGEIQLFDLEADIGEVDDIADQHPDVVAHMSAIMKGAHVPDPRWIPRTDAAGLKEE
jgi:arylsulfatase A-like enzyme